MVDKNTKRRALWFINEEMERILRDLESGTINKEQAIGSYNTMFSLASAIEDIQYMKTICRLISHLRSTNYYFNIKKLYHNKYFSEEQAPLESREIKESKDVKEFKEIKEMIYK